MYLGFLFYAIFHRKVSAQEQSKALHLEIFIVQFDSSTSIIFHGDCDSRMKNETSKETNFAIIRVLSFDSLRPVRRFDYHVDLNLDTHEKTIEKFHFSIVRC